MTIAWPLVQFAASAVLIARAGYGLSRGADALAEAHGGGRCVLRPRPLLADASPVPAGTAVTAGTMPGLVIIGLVPRPQGRTLRVASGISIGLVATYVVNAALAYLGGA